MKKFALLSCNTPTDEQVKLAVNSGIELVKIGDADVFTVGPGFIDSAGDFEGVVVAHPTAAMRLCSDYKIGVFENKSSAAVALHVYDLRS